jgi:hypothetical protein
LFNQSVKHFNKALSSFNTRVVVSARRLEEMDAHGKKVIEDVNEIEVRASTAPTTDEPARKRRVSAQPTLTLALSSADDGS